MAMDANEFASNLWNWSLNFAADFPQDYILPNLQIIIQIGLLIVVGYILGKLGKAITEKLLSIAGLKKVTIRSWTDDILRAIGYRGNIVSLIGDMVKWFIYIMFIGLIIEMLGFPSLLNIFTQIAVFLPLFIIAILVIVVGFLVADFMGKVFEEAGRRFFNDETISTIAGTVVKYVVALVAIILALGIVGLDATALNIVLAIALLGIISIMLLALKDILPEFTAGLYLKKALKSGDHIKVGTHKGTVESVNSVSVTIKEGTKSVSLPNTLILKNVTERDPSKRGK